MNRLLVVAVLGIGAGLFLSDNRAQAQFGFGYGVPTVPSSAAYCAPRTVRSYGYSSYSPRYSYYPSVNPYAVSRASFYSPYRVNTVVTPALPAYGFGARAPGYSYRVAPAPVTALPRVQLRLGF